MTDKEKSQLVMKLAMKMMTLTDAELSKQEAYINKLIAAKLESNEK